MNNSNKAEEEEKNAMGYLKGFPDCISEDEFMRMCLFILNKYKTDNVFIVGDEFKIHTESCGGHYNYLVLFKSDKTAIQKHFEIRRQQVTGFELGEEQVIINIFQRLYARFGNYHMPNQIVLKFEKIPLTTPEKSVE